MIIFSLDTLCGTFLFGGMTSGCHSKKISDDETRRSVLVPQSNQVDFCNYNRGLVVKRRQGVSRSTVNTGPM